MYRRLRDQGYECDSSEPEPTLVDGSSWDSASPSHSHSDRKDRRDAGEKDEKEEQASDLASLGSAADTVSLANINHWLDRTPGIRAKDRQIVAPDPVVFPVDAPDCPALQSRISWLFDTHGIGSSLCGEIAAAIAGAPIRVQNCEWAIDEADLDRAAELLRLDGFPCCPADDHGTGWRQKAEGRDASETTTQYSEEESDEELPDIGEEGEEEADDEPEKKDKKEDDDDKTKGKRVKCAVLRRHKPEHRDYPRPAYHFHTDHRYPTSAYDADQSRGVFLYPKRVVIHEAIPSPPAGPASHTKGAHQWPFRVPDDEMYGPPVYQITASNELPTPGFGLLHYQGKQDRRLYPVNMLTPLKAVENLVRLIMRHQGEWVNNWWQRLFTVYMVFVFNVNHLQHPQDLSDHVKLEMEGTGDWVENQLDFDTQIDRAFRACWGAIQSKTRPDLMYRHGPSHKHFHYLHYHRQQVGRPWYQKPNSQRKGIVDFPTPY
ncbi:uncharacterized protein BP01DRAFT_403060 [Aspergillus saccharolyticus JOP 1030-1]|uniref:Uncharacterized protein n=1 Tax=Aspergillus saccharolyticus JOP 1030-1 TaxID=1450539 RepID=A0A318Z6Y5_9EURO|nr:hypothetical protein BP01DRAFT_403060 [Aspergillus saccharolyticus JOP 1030-1]PYH43091.1 hypothetical protein BP01DRAFT_403060 [Aspergillus saccharolyticus JOP 1030-1]